MADPAGFAACDKCEGTGIRNNGPETSGIGRPDWFEEWPCPSCQGSGLDVTETKQAPRKPRGRSPRSHLGGSIRTLPNNLRLVNRKHRYCGQCRREANRRYRARKKAQQ